MCATERSRTTPGAGRPDAATARRTAGEAGGRAARSAVGVATGARDATLEAIRALKPRLRGWIHACTAPLALAACIVLTALAPTAGLRWASAVYLACSLLLFANSGLYHLSNGHLSTRISRVLQRIDHANIYLLIAGTYTPLSAALLDRPTATLVLGIVWGGALAGIITTLVWTSVPRWFATLLYIILGWVAIWFLPAFWRSGGPAIVWLLVAGGVAYTIGGATYARHWPDPLPRWFGFHEVFHVWTVAAWVCQCIACFLAILG